MKTHTIMLEGVPLLAPQGVLLPFTKISECPPCCGAGDGIGEKLIPETMWGLPISPACYIHDKEWPLAQPTWEAFHASNSHFLHNLVTLVNYTSQSDILRHIRLYRCVTYYNAVDSQLNHVFWKLKEEQQSKGMWQGFSPVADIVKELLSYRNSLPKV